MNVKRHLLVIICLVIFACSLAESSSRGVVIKLDNALRARQQLTVTFIGNLAAGGRQAFILRLPRQESLELRVPFAEAPFNGTQLNAQINDRLLAPYFAFGGDTRYDSVKGKPGMRPPLATIEGRWVIPARWLREGDNQLVLWTTGVKKDAALERLGPKPAIRIGGVTVGPLDGARLPEYANSIYYDFNVWAQGYPWGDEPNRLNYDLALLGVINGKGMPCIAPPLGGPESSLWGIKRACEDNALGWGMKHQEFYTIWEFCERPELWADFFDVDNNLETTGQIHGQTVFPHRLPKGTDYVLFNTAKYTASLEPAIRFLAPYTDFYNFKCEQAGPWGQGFDWNGEGLKDNNVHGDLWARNYYEANKAAHDLVKKYDADDGRVQEMNHWLPGMRTVLYDTAIKRGQPMSDVIDIMMMHFAGMEENDRGPDGLPTKENAFKKQFPYATEEHPGNVYPEDAIDFNRYRLGRTEKDMKLGDPKVNRWGNGQPFDYQAGLRGDEPMYNSENGVWNTGYCATSPYQFLHGFFSYSLLPTGASEPRDLKITTRQSPTETKDVAVRRYGEWIDGAGHTKRLRTVDPLYGDMFGWTGQEYCNFGDYITMVGIKEPHHRMQPNDAFNLVRRICYGFVTTGPVVPLAINKGSGDQLFVKGLAQTFNSQQYIGIYAANYSNKTEKLDVTLPIAFPAGTRALVFDDRSWDWKQSARPLPVPAGADFRYKTAVPALGAWLVLIPVSADTLAGAFGLPAAPAQLSPVVDGTVTEGQPAFEWKAADPRARFTVEVAREALFRPEDRVELAEGIAGTSYTMTVPLVPKWRYFWRISAVDAQGSRGPWSAPRAFVYRWPEYSQAFPPQENPLPPAQPAISDGPAGPVNLAWLGEIWGTGGNMHAPTNCIDGQDFSFWTNSIDDGGQNNGIPAEWCVIWPGPTAVSGATIKWMAEFPPLEFALQVSDDGKEWKELYKQADNIGAVSEIALPKPATARFFRIYITRAKNEKGVVGMTEVMLR